MTSWSPVVKEEPHQEGDILHYFMEKQANLDKFILPDEREGRKTKRRNETGNMTLRRAYEYIRSVSDQTRDREDDYRIVWPLDELKRTEHDRQMHEHFKYEWLIDSIESDNRYSNEFMVTEARLVEIMKHDILLRNRPYLKGVFRI